MHLSARGEFDFGCSTSLASGPGLPVCEVSPILGLFLAPPCPRAGLAKTLMQGAHTEVLGGLPAWKIAPHFHWICMAGMGMGLSQWDQYLQWSKQNIPINGKKTAPVWKEEGRRGRLVFPGPF